MNLETLTFSGRNGEKWSPGMSHHLNCSSKNPSHAPTVVSGPSLSAAQRGMSTDSDSTFTPSLLLKNAMRGKGRSEGAEYLLKSSELLLNCSFMDAIVSVSDREGFPRERT